VSLQDALAGRNVVARCTFGRVDYELLDTGRVLEWRHIGKGLRRELGPAYWLNESTLRCVREELERRRAMDFGAYCWAMAARTL